MRIFRDMDVTVDHNEIDGNGPHNIIGQNALQLSSGSFGDVTNNVISGIGYTPGTNTSCGVLVFDSAGGLNIDDNTFNGTGEDDAASISSIPPTSRPRQYDPRDADIRRHRHRYGRHAVNDVTDNTYTNVETNYGFYPGAGDLGPHRLRH